MPTDLDRGVLSQRGPRNTLDPWRPYAFFAEAEPDENGAPTDIATIFLTGIPGLNQPATVTPSEMLRLNTRIAGSAFPKGRWLADDVVDAEIRALAGATAFTPAFNVSPNRDLGDGVDANDFDFGSSFPYLAPPAGAYHS